MNDPWTKIDWSPKPGDRITIPGALAYPIRKQLSRRKWWQFWKPKWTACDEPQTFVIAANAEAPPA